jgi:hypothetical protein
MKKSYFISFMLGFLFGTVGMYLLAMLSLIFVPAERIANVFLSMVDTWRSNLLALKGAISKSFYLLYLMGFSMALSSL